MIDTTISQSVRSFKSWFVANGGHFHLNAQFQQGERRSFIVGALSLSDVALPQSSDASGYKIIADKEIPPDTTIVTCPFALVITKELAADAILAVLKSNDTPPKWTERQFICTYVCLHWVFEA